MLYTYRSGEHCSISSLNTLQTTTENSVTTRKNKNTTVLAKRDHAVLRKAFSMRCDAVLCLARVFTWASVHRGPCLLFMDNKTKGYFKSAANWEEARIGFISQLS